ncbi:hypothetical protein [Sporosarcina trichiuri]|uniref:hypothetical protein n=1 Tax=Sporosarcina trichiuri TaxID=3056445 RepID=UPI0025B2D1DC|nr:hypothetical protein [Sporosarcina sp. 0.2-SM1T-5]WJY26481.1 hypothetical protein QWT68_10350 [Sporosarcina sp. 0.2-SM1T-5]
MQPDSIVLHVPGLGELLGGNRGQIHEKLGLRSPGNASGIREGRMMYLTGRTIGRVYFDSIVVDGRRNRITFRRLNADRGQFEETVCRVMEELGISEYSPASLSYWLLAPGWQVREDDGPSPV